MSNYTDRYRKFADQNVYLVHTPEQYRLTSELPQWYPILQDLTPRSVWFDTLPPVSEIESSFEWPVFVKGERQTNRHQRRLSIIESSNLSGSWMAGDAIRFWLGSAWSVVSLFHCRGQAALTHRTACPEASSFVRSGGKGVALAWGCIGQGNQGRWRMSSAGPC